MATSNHPASCRCADCQASSVNPLTYLDPAEYVLDALNANKPHEEIISGLALFSLSNPSWPQGTNYDGYLDGVIVGMFRPRYPNVLFRPYDEGPTGILARLGEYISRKMGLLPDAIGVFDANGNFRRFKKTEGK